MPSERRTGRLEDIEEHGRLALSFVAGMDFEQFRADRRTVLAVVRCLEVISEASRHLDADFKARHPNIKWRDVASAGNFYRHDYPSISDDIIWATLQRELVPLLAAVESELSSR